MNEWKTLEFDRMELGNALRTSAGITYEDVESLKVQTDCNGEVLTVRMLLKERE